MLSCQLARTDNGLADTGSIKPRTRFTSHLLDRPGYCYFYPTLTLIAPNRPVTRCRRLRGAIYARFSTEHQDSIDDQVRKCREWADEHGVTIQDQHIFADAAKTGRGSRRHGLAALRAALADDQIDVVITLTTSRLYRTAYKAAQFVEEEIVDKGKRAVFIDTGIDTADEDRWRAYLQIRAMIDQFTATATVGHIRAAQEGLFMAGRVFGSLTFGYTGQEVPGMRTRNGGTGRRIVIDPVASEWVKKAFGWYLQDRLSILQIAQRLNSEGAPPPPHVQDQRWSQAAVRRMLGNERYTGRWAYGKTKSVWNNAKSYTRQVPREQPLKAVHREDLRIIDDVTFQKAQQMLAANRHQVAGRKPCNPSISRPKLLNGLLYCPAHDRALIAGAHYGKHMFCPVCKKEPVPTLYSVLPRQLAQQKICQTLADLIRQDDDLVEQAITACRRHVEADGKPDLAQLEALKRKEANFTAKINFILDAPGDTEEDRAESKRKLQTLRAERSAVQTQIAEMEAAVGRVASIPTADQVRQKIDELANILLRAADGQEAAGWGAARRILEQITGGKIIVTQRGEAKAKRGWLRGAFQVHMVQLLANRCGGTCQDEVGPEIHVDFRDPPAEAVIAEKVKALFDQGMLYKDIAQQLGVYRPLVVKALKYWYSSQGLPLPDGRRRRFELDQKSPKAYKFQQIAEEALGLYDQGLPLQDIAARLGCDRTTAGKAVQHAQTQRGLVPVDGRTRRKSLDTQTAVCTSEPAGPQVAGSDSAGDTPVEGARPAA